MPPRQRNNKFVRIDKTKGFMLEVIQWGRSNKVCLYSLLGPDFPVSVYKEVFLPPGTGRAPITWDSHFLLSGGQRRVRVFFLHQLFFLSNFNST